MNKELEHISNWFKANKLSLNINKTKWLIIHSSAKKRQMPSSLPELSIDKIIIKRDTTLKFLRVLIDENLTWKNHIDYVSSKISKNIGILYKAREILNRNNLRQLYFAFIQSYLQYANIAWASTHKSKLNQIFRHQKHAIRIINFKNRYTHAKALLEETKALSIYKINLFSILCLLYKCKNKKSPSIMQDLYTLKPVNKYVLRSKELIQKPACKTKFGQFCINY